MNKRKIAIAAWCCCVLVAAFFAFDLGRFFSLDYVKGAQAEFAALYAERPCAGDRRLLRRSTSR